MKKNRKREKNRKEKRKHEGQDDQLYIEERKRQIDQGSITKFVSGNIVSSVDANRDPSVGPIAANGLIWSTFYILKLFL